MYLLFNFSVETQTTLSIFWFKGLLNSLSVKIDWLLEDMLGKEQLNRNDLIHRTYIFHAMLCGPKTPQGCHNALLLLVKFTDLLLIRVMLPLK